MEFVEKKYAMARSVPAERSMRIGGLNYFFQC
jgi:hypothetical protein